MELAKRSSFVPTETSCPPITPLFGYFTNLCPPRLPPETMCQMNNNHSIGGPFSRASDTQLPPIGVLYQHTCIIKLPRLPATNSLDAENAIILWACHLWMGSQKRRLHQSRVWNCLCSGQRFTQIHSPQNQWLHEGRRRKRRNKKQTSPYDVSINLS